MKIILQEEGKYILRFDGGEEVIEKLNQFCKKEKIESGYFFGIGSTSEVILAYYDLKKRQYLDRIFRKDLEIISAQGNISKLEGKIIIHAHGIFSGRDYKTIAGHIKKMTISATCEFVLEKLEGKIERKHNKETGLNLMK